MRRKFSFHVSWNFIPTIYWPRCISSAHSNTNKLRPTKRGKRWRCSRRNNFPRQRPQNAQRKIIRSSLVFRGERGARQKNKGWKNYRRCVENARKRSAHEFSLPRNLRNGDGRGCGRIARARVQGHGVG